jgi:hypothetical protein
MLQDMGLFVSFPWTWVFVKTCCQYSDKQSRPQHDPEREVLDLTAIVHLDPDDLAHVRAAALTLDRHGYSVSKVYSKTALAK